LFVVLGGPLPILEPKEKSSLPLLIIFELEPTMAQYEGMLLHLLEVSQCLWHLQSMLSKGWQCNTIKLSHEEKTSYQLVDTVATLLAVLHVLECAIKMVALQLNEAPPLRK
jgi:hypothetical protein